MPERFTGLISATFAPLHEDGSLHLELAGTVIDHLEARGVSAIFVNGTTGEGPSLSSRERMDIAAAYSSAARGRLRTIVHVGHNSIAEAASLAAHAAEIGADAISAVPPSYYRIDSVGLLADCLRQISAGAPETPFFYYHIPRFTSAALDMGDLLRVAPERVPALAGIKFSEARLDMLQRCVEEHGERYNLLFGADEMLLSGLLAGAEGAVGSTYNFSARLYQRVIDRLAAGDLEGARRDQGAAVRIVDAILRHDAHPALKHTMSLAGIDCGPPRLPLRPLSATARETLERDLRQTEFFEWL